MKPVLIFIAIIGLFGCTISEFVKPVALRINIPIQMEKGLEQLIKDQKGDLDAELDTRIKTMHSSVDQVNKNMDHAQNALYLVQKVVGVILSAGDKFNKGFAIVADHFKTRPETLHDLKMLVNKLAERLPGFTTLVQNLINAGFDTDEMKEALEALQALQDKLLLEMVKAVEALPDISKITAQGGT